MASELRVGRSSPSSRFQKAQPSPALPRKKGGHRVQMGKSGRKKQPGFLQSVFSPVKKAKAAKARSEKSTDHRSTRSPTVSLPMNVVWACHVDNDLNWTGENMFEVVRQLGRGAFGTVYLGKHVTSGMSIAIKELAYHTAADEDEVKREIEILKACKHASIVSYFGTCTKGDNLWILMDYCKLGSVRDMIEACDNEPLSEPQIKVITKCVATGLVYLHAKNIIHRDIKCANILLNAEAQVKIADFGVSDVLGKSKELIGTPYWMAPEVCEAVRYDSKADIWSLGITIIEMAESRPPRTDLPPLRVMKMVPRLPPPSLSNPHDWSREMNEFLSQCLVKDPTKRPSAIELMSHPFLRNCADVGRIMRNRVVAVLKSRKKKLDSRKDGGTHDVLEIDMGNIVVGDASPKVSRGGGLSKSSPTALSRRASMVVYDDDSDDADTMVIHDDDDDGEGMGTMVIHRDGGDDEAPNDRADGGGGGDDSDDNFSTVVIDLTDELVDGESPIVPPWRARQSTGGGGGGDASAAGERTASWMNAIDTCPDNETGVLSALLGGGGGGGGGHAGGGDSCDATGGTDPVPTFPRRGVPTPKADRRHVKSTNGRGGMRLKPNANWGRKRRDVSPSPSPSSPSPASPAPSSPAVGTTSPSGSSRAGSLVRQKSTPQLWQSPSVSASHVDGHSMRGVGARSAAASPLVSPPSTPGSHRRRLGSVTRMRNEALFPRSVSTDAVARSTSPEFVGGSGGGGGGGLSDVKIRMLVEAALLDHLGPLKSQVTQLQEAHDAQQARNDELDAQVKSIRSNFLRWSRVLTSKLTGVVAEMNSEADRIRSVQGLCHSLTQQVDSIRQLVTAMGRGADPPGRNSGAEEAEEDFVCVSGE